MNKGAYHFPHFCSARTDTRLLYLIDDLGLEGYGAYNILLESLRNQPTLKSSFKKIPLLSKKYNIPTETLEAIVRDYDLFKVDDSEFFSETLSGHCKSLRKNTGRIRLSDVNYPQWREISTAVFMRDDFTCHYCGQEGGILEADHIVPFVKGGSDTMDNLVTACRSCNRKKHSKSYKEFTDGLS